MKKTLLYCISFVFLISIILSNDLFATEEAPVVENVEQQQTPESIVEQVQNFEEKCKAEVKKIGEIRDSEENPNCKIQEVTLEILDGQYKDKEVTANYTIYNKDKFEKYQLEIGDELDVIIFGDMQGNLFVSIQSLHRISIISMLLFILFISIFILYGKQSLKPILSIITLMILVYFIVLSRASSEKNVIVSTIIFGIIISIIESVINNGLNKKIWISLLGVASGVLCSTVISTLFMSVSRINLNIKNDFNVQLIISSVIIISVGFCLNLCMQIIYNLDSGKIDTKDAFQKDLFKLGIIFGQRLSIKFIKSLIIGFIGMYFVFIVPNADNYKKVINVLNQDLVAYGIISIFSICIGMLVSIPVTSVLYSLINSKKTKYKIKSDNKVDGKRSLKI